MSIVSSITIADTHTQADGTRRVRYEFTDHLGVKHGWGPHKVFNHVTTPFSPEPHTIIYAEDAGDTLIWDGATWQVFRTFELQARIETKLKETEVYENLRLLSEGVDIFAASAIHQTDNELFKSVLDKVVVLDIISLTEYHLGIPHMNGLSNPFITGLGYTWTVWQDWMSDANTLKVAVDGYNPMTV